MHRIHDWISTTILNIIDLFYPLFKKLMPLQTFRYAACGGGNTILDISIFIICHDYIFKGLPIQIGWLPISAHIASFLVAFSITFPIGFYLSRYVVFQETDTRKTEQLIKYLSVVMFCLVLNYGFLKLFVEVFMWHPLPSKLLTTVFVVSFSYLSQKNFTFKAKE
jgi:putative flippase GtrA